MNKREMQILNKCWDHEVESALSKSMYCFQTKSRVAEILHEDGFLEDVEFKVGKPPLQVTVRGYQLSHAGRIVVCASPVPRQAPSTAGQLKESGK